MASCSNYEVVLIRSEEGFAVFCPTLPGCASQGETEAEALENIKDAIHAYVSVVRERSERERAELASTDPGVETFVREVLVAV
jgi:predicted RNase H-like HicB family nuclease